MFQIFRFVHYLLAQGDSLMFLISDHPYLACGLFYVIGLAMGFAAASFLVAQKVVDRGEPDPADFTGIGA